MSPHVFYQKNSAMANSCSVLRNVPFFVQTDIVAMSVSTDPDTNTISGFGNQHCQKVYRRQSPSHWVGNQRETLIRKCISNPVHYFDNPPQKWDSKLSPKMYRAIYKPYFGNRVAKMIAKMIAISTRFDYCIFRFGNSSKFRTLRSLFYLK